MTKTNKTSPSWWNDMNGVLKATIIVVCICIGFGIIMAIVCCSKEQETSEQRVVIECSKSDSTIMEIYKEIQVIHSKLDSMQNDSIGVKVVRIRKFNE